MNEIGFETGEPYCSFCEEYGHSLGDCHEAADFATYDDNVLTDK